MEFIIKDLYNRLITIPVYKDNCEFEYLNNELYYLDSKKINITQLSVSKFPNFKDRTNSINLEFYKPKRKITIHDFCQNFPFEKLNKNKERYYQFQFQGDDNNCLLMIKLNGNFKVNKIVRKLNKIFK